MQFFKITKEKLKKYLLVLLFTFAIKQADKEVLSYVPSIVSTFGNFVCKSATSLKSFPQTHGFDVVRPHIQDMEVECRGGLYL